MVHNGIEYGPDGPPYAEGLNNFSSTQPAGQSHREVGRRKPRLFRNSRAHQYDFNLADFSPKSGAAAASSLMAPRPLNLPSPLFDQPTLEPLLLSASPISGRRPADHSSPPFRSPPLPSSRSHRFRFISAFIRAGERRPSPQSQGFCPAMRFPVFGGHIERKGRALSPEAGNRAAPTQD